MFSIQIVYELCFLNLDTCKITLVGHAFSVIALTLLRNDELASGSEDSTIKVWDINTGELKKTLVGHSSVGFIKITVFFFKLFNIK